MCTYGFVWLCIDACVYLWVHGYVCIQMSMCVCEGGRAVLMHITTQMYSHMSTDICMCACVTMLYFTDNSSCLVVMGTTVLKMWIPLHVGQRNQKRESSVTNTSRAPKAKAGNCELRIRQVPTGPRYSPILRISPLCQGLYPNSLNLSIFPSFMLSGNFLPFFCEQVRTAIKSLSELGRLGEMEVECVGQTRFLPQRELKGGNI